MKRFISSLKSFLMKKKIIGIFVLYFLVYLFYGIVKDRIGMIIRVHKKDLFDWSDMKISYDFLIIYFCYFSLVILIKVFEGQELKNRFSFFHFFIPIASFISVMGVFGSFILVLYLMVIGLFGWNLGLTDPYFFRPISYFFNLFIFWIYVVMTIYTFVNRDTLLAEE